MIPKFISESTKNLLVLFDMDGVLAEYVYGENVDILQNVPGVYAKKRPIASLIRVAKELSEIDGVTVGVMSSCCYPTQRAEKLEWLNTHLPFIDKAHVYVLVWEELGLKGDDRNAQKGKEIQKIRGFDKIYLVDDKHKIINATNALLPDCAHHVSEFID